MNDAQRIRLDQFLSENGFAETRSRARDLILRGAVRVDGGVVTKPGALVAPGRSIEVDGAQNPYVSRGGLKLEYALKHYGFSPEGVIAIDAGSSTGGFSDVLLRGGAKRVYGVDVGTGQLHASLRHEPRMIVLEGTDVRNLTPEIIPEPVTSIVSDVSFISLTQALPPAMSFAAPGAWLVALIKPQFELEAREIGKGGIVRSEEARLRAVDKVAAWLAGCPGWRALEPVQSPITGKGGNIEYLIGATFDG
ncbi:MAG: TlyA family RNA methyltransferase [Hyphomicrobiaceae bacterium]